ncbi:prolyl oligopeptidase family serine peptidase [Gracilibacillus alcaliphilus]|uniref:prolyl oligopeptidase family serine peptidase n=1 Tax=Gracilibacillus alcaliphilus TaxID=1401441 RepID=UPI001958E94F|nr:prolyl oligopeptidase family serine peptidase [Gracilibacillus alcaliphilus]MBM7675447.1 fermentation-respiration switch protein FrsA (DUF1100 family) [Gracilibacillus alcaliphilus]
MIIVNKEYWNNIPLLHIVEAEKREQPLPTLTYFHGITGGKEDNLPIAYLLAEKGYRVLLPDCLLHGEREEDLGRLEIELRFFEVIKQNLDDLESLYHELIAKGLLEDNRFGAAGTSMGGITTAAALTQFAWIKAAGVLMGTPKITAYMEDRIAILKQNVTELPVSDQMIEVMLTEAEEMDLSLQIEKLFERPLFFWHGTADEVVPFKHAYDFYEEAVGQYKNPENIRFLKQPDRGHKVSRLAVLELVDWLAYQL